MARYRSRPIDSGKEKEKKKEGFPVLLDSLLNGTRPPCPWSTKRHNIDTQVTLGSTNLVQPHTVVLRAYGHGSPPDFNPTESWCVILGLAIHNKSVDELYRGVWNGDRHYKGLQPLPVL